MADAREMQSTIEKVRIFDMQFKLFEHGKLKESLYYALQSEAFSCGGGKSEAFVCRKMDELRSAYVGTRDAIYKGRLKRKPGCSVHCNP